MEVRINSSGRIKFRRTELLGALGERVSVSGHTGNLLFFTFPISVLGGVSGKWGRLRKISEVATLGDISSVVRHHQMLCSLGSDSLVCSVCISMKICPS